MLDKLFMQVLDMSRIAGAVILVVILARLFLRKAPKTVSYALWAVVLFRLLCPMSIKAPVSIVPEVTPVSQSCGLADEPVSLAGAGSAALNGGLGIQHIPTEETDENGAVRYVTASWRDVCILFGQYVWIAGIAAMLLHSAVSYVRLRRKLQIAVPLRENIYMADDIQSPFVIGFIRPKIYLPCGLDEKEQEYIILHEQHHIRRFDHICKALAFLALCIHWFNPLVWLAFVLAGRDMEMSCDEAVVRKMGGGIRAEYSASLLTLATGRRIIAGTPLAFGEGNAKERIKNLGKWKQPVLWAVIAASAVCILLAVCLATDPTDGSGRTSQINGLVTELQTGNDGALTAIVIQTDKEKKTGIMLTEDIIAFPPEGGPGTQEELRAAFQAALRPDMMIEADCVRGRKVLTTDSGERITAYRARYIRVTGKLERGAVTLRDGTLINVLEENYFSRRTYMLEDGTDLLRVNTPSGPENVYVGGTESLDSLEKPAREQVLAYYEQRGLLYDEQEELEKVYALCQELGEDFRSGMVEQIAAPTASSDRVIYFLTEVRLPAGRENGNIMYNIRLGDAFDRETGAHIDTWDLFTAPKEAVVQALLDAGGVFEQPMRAEMEAASWDGHIVFFAEHLDVMFEAGSLPSETNSSGLAVDFVPAVLELMQDWAVPESPAKDGR